MSTSTQRLAGKNVLITGAGQGMGAAHARLLVNHGAKVMLTDISEANVTNVARELGAAAVCMRHDVSDANDWTNVVKTAEEAFGPINVLVNNAGVLHFAPIEETSEDDYRRVLNVNQIGCLLGMKGVLPSMKRAGGGSIVNISSVAGLAGQFGLSAYVSSKFAVTGLTKVAALEFGKYNIRVNSVHPGGVATPMTDGLPAPKTQPIPRLALPEEVSFAVLYLASDESSYTTGSAQVVDGGYLNMVGELLL